jgi:hypothetical protein
VLIEVYGSLLNRDERKKIKGTMTEKGKVERKGWTLSFDKKSFSRSEAVLNFVRTNNSNDVYYTCVYEVDADTHTEVLRREMGQGNAEKWLHSEAVKFNSYRPLRLESNLGTTEIFVIPETERLLTPTSWDAEYVVIVRKGIDESFKDMPKEKAVNLQVLKKAVEESNRKGKRCE